MYNIIIVLRALNHFFICYNLRHVYLSVEFIKKIYYYVNLNSTSSNSLSPMGAQNKDLRAAS